MKKTVEEKISRIDNSKRLNKKIDRRYNRLEKKIVGRDSLLYTIASLSIETGIAPSEFINMDTEMFRAIMQVLADRAKELKNASRSKRR